MSIRKFRPQDILLNTMKAHPRCEFFIFDGKVYYNSIPEHSGAFSANVVTRPGFISLYEYNIDKADSTAGADSYNDFIRPFISKNSSGGSFKTIADASANNEWTVAEVGDQLNGTYPMTASITREFLEATSEGFLDPIYDDRIPENQKITAVGSPGSPRGEPDIDANIGEDARLVPINRHYWALRNRLNFYGTRSPHYKVTGSLLTNTADPDAHYTYYEWIKDYQNINLISIPSIFYGNRIKPGSVSLKWYYTGSMCGELRDIKRNGELIQVSGGVHAADHNDKVAGVILYDEGFIFLTGSWDLMPNHGLSLKKLSASVDPAWIYFGAGAQDGVSSGNDSAGASRANYISSSFNISFEGETETQVMTMFAHAKRGQVNYSNNPSYLMYGQKKLRVTSSHIYEENPLRLLANVNTSSFAEHSASFKRQVYVSRVAIYDETKKLIGIATLADPVLKEEDQDYTFKLRLDI